MDQFCANQNESYRRCVCSSRLTEIQSRERALSQTGTQLQDFRDLNISVIPKTGAEVQAMLSATAGEAAAANAKDDSASAQTLDGISEVLSGTKNKALSSSGSLDIAGDINSIWSTATDLAGTANIANLTGESLYNAVHTQCADLIAGNCSSSSVLNMVVSAYGMYIENDCSLLINELDKKLNNANSEIRKTEREMTQARLENYDAHNSTSINDCVANVRADITRDTACGTDYVHCLDISGRYLNYNTGEPIYTPDFYQLNYQTSLSGNTLTNSSNRLIVAELNRKREFAKNSLETCRDLADDVWDEFMRQAIVEIHQGQQEKIRQVKTECLSVVNECYDAQNLALTDFSSIKEQLLLGQRMELAEQMCQDKLYTCSNLYGSGDTDTGLQLLLTAMHNITDEKIAQNCRVTLEEFAKDMCTPPTNDTLHAYPYACRVYAPGDAMYASNYECNQALWQSTSNTTDNNTSTDTGTGDTNVTAQIELLKTVYLRATSGYSCPIDGTTPNQRKYTSCSPGYFLAIPNASGTKFVYNATSVFGNACAPCSYSGCSICAGGTKAPTKCADPECGTDYIGSLYQKLVRYALQTCVRPSESNSTDYVLPATILADINTVMDSIRVSMSVALSAECERLGGEWIDIPTAAPDGKYADFYDETSSNTMWGYCKKSRTLLNFNTILGGGTTGGNTGGVAGGTTGGNTGGIDGL